MATELKKFNSSGGFSSNNTVVIDENCDFTANAITANGTISGLDGQFTGNLTLGGNVVGYRDSLPMASGNVTLATTDSGKHYWSDSGNTTVTVPNNATTALATGTRVDIIAQAGNVEISSDTGVTLYANGVSNGVPAAYVTSGRASLLKVDSDTWFVDGAVVPPVHNVTQNTYHDSIAWAVFYASSGDVIEVQPGVYQEQVQIDKPLTLRGPNYQKTGYDPTRGEEAVLQYMPSFGDFNTIVGVSAANVTIEGMSFDCPESLVYATPTPVYSPYGIYFYAQDNFTFRNNRMYGGEIALGIYTGGVARSGLLIEGNYIDCGPWVNDSYNRALYIWNSSGFIQDNVIVNCNTGIQFSVVTTITLSAQTTVRRNKVSASGTGLYNNVMPRGTATHNWTDNTVTVSPNDRQGAKKLVGGTGGQWGPLGQTNWSAAFIAYTGTEGASSTPPTVSMKNNLFNIARDPTQVYNNNNWVGTRFATGGTGGGVSANAVIQINNNSLTNWTIGVLNPSAANANMANNWWGTSNSSNVVIQNTGTGNVVITPISTLGANGYPSTANFV